jgi:nucleotide-binding universal stress UspA family protein
MHQSDRDRYLAEIKQAHKEWLSDLLAEFGLDRRSAKIHLLKGDPGNVIPRVAKKTNAELVVMGTVARTGVPGFLIGNTAEKTLSKLKCSVLAVKPACFETPVRI